MIEIRDSGGTNWQVGFIPSHRGKTWYADKRVLIFGPTPREYTDLPEEPERTVGEGKPAVYH